MSAGDRRGEAQEPPTSEQQGDRWSGYGEQTGIRRIWRDQDPDTLRRYEIFRDLKDSFLEEISPDVMVAEWDKRSILFEEGTYLDLAFYVVDGTVELALQKLEASAAPIFAGDTPTDGTQVIRKPRSAVGGETIAHLATMDFDLGAGERAVLSEGDFFGEIGALNGWPQSVTASCSSVCTLIHIRVPALRKLKRKSKALRERLDSAYRSRTLHRQLQTTPLLADCSPDVVKSLAEKVELVSLEPGDTVATQSERAEALYLVRSGFLKVTEAVGARDMVVSYASKGMAVGGVELLIDGIANWQSSVTSVGYSELVKLSHTDFHSVLRQHPGVESQLWETAIDQIKTSGNTRRRPDRSELTEFALEKGVVQGTSVLVIDLDVCTRCDDCVRGCASTHDGRPRFVREGEKFGGFLVARSCYHCQDPVCLIGCPTGAIARLNIGSVVAIDDALCIGCGSCADNCPYDAIVMHDTETIWGPTATPQRLRGEQREVASKCDLCHDSEAGPACVSSCPHGCAYRVSDVGEFDALLRAKTLHTAATAMPAESGALS
ncbi:MAG: cyclic nucleotide-binding domain-containing protein [Longimicrobiales bacterium]